MASRRGKIPHQGRHLDDPEDGGWKQDKGEEYLQPLGIKIVVDGPKAGIPHSPVNGGNNKKKISSYEPLWDFYFYETKREGIVIN